MMLYAAGLWIEDRGTQYVPWMFDAMIASSDPAPMSDGDGRLPIWILVAICLLAETI